jgi:RNase P subunit RPR2
MLIQRILDYSGTVFVGNPRAYEHWLSFTNRGFDIKVLTRKNTWIKVECKLLLEPIFQSWFDRDWLGRDADVYVTNDMSMIPTECIDKAHASGRMILTPIELLNYVEGNKLIDLNDIPNNNSKDISCFNEVYKENSDVVCEESHDESHQIEPPAKTDTKTLMENITKTNNSIDIKIETKSETETLMKNTRNINNSIDQKLTNTLKEIFKSVLNKVNYQRRRKEFQEVRAMADRTVTPSLFRHYKKLNVPLCCSKCGRSFSIGDKYARISKTNLYCPKCAETMFYDLPDSNEEMTYNFITPEGNTIPVTEVV